MWIDGKAILLAESLDRKLLESECVVLAGMAPRVCGVLEAFELSAEDFEHHIEGTVPVNDASRQAPCEPRRPRP